jgi:hypothetical protein
MQLGAQLLGPEVLALLDLGSGQRIDALPATPFLNLCRAHLACHFKGS